jgi:hypothetical protein
MCQLCQTNCAKNALRFALGRPVPEILTFQIIEPNRIETNRIESEFIRIDESNRIASSIDFQITSSIDTHRCSAKQVQEQKKGTAPPRPPSCEE